MSVLLAEKYRVESNLFEDAAELGIPVCHLLLKTQKNEAGSTMRFL